MKKQNHTSQNGITLIALIITIIVMLILVGVTINVVLTGGLFTKAEEAKKGTQIASEKEQLLNAILGTLDDNGKFNLDQIILPSGFRPVSEDSSKVIYEGPSTNQYEVDKGTGQIEEKEKNDNNKPNEDDMLGLYGKKEYLAIEVLGNGKSVLYEDGIGINGEYNNGVATFIYNYTDQNGDEKTQTITANYTFDLIKDEQSGEIINKILCYELEGTTMFFTTQEVAGLDLDLYNNRHYRSELDNNIYFYDGWFECYLGSTEHYNYCVYQGYIWIYEEGEYAFQRLASINSDGTFTIVYDMGDGVKIGDIYTEVK